MLARVLLHVVEAAGPVQHQSHRSFGKGSGQAVTELPGVAAHLQHLDAVGRAPVTGLAAALRVEHCVLQDRPALALLHPSPQDLGVEGTKAGVKLVAGDPFHAGSLARTTALLHSPRR